MLINGFYIKKMPYLTIKLTIFHAVTRETGYVKVVNQHEDCRVTLLVGLFVFLNKQKTMFDLDFISSVLYETQKLETGTKVPYGTLHKRPNVTKVPYGTLHKCPNVTKVP